MKIKVLAALGLAAAFAAATAALGGSIWAKGNPRAQAIHSDDTARQIGDVLTIVINEQSKIKNESERKLEKQSTRDISIQSNLDALRGLDTATGSLFNLKDLSLKTSGNTKFDGKADFDSGRTVTDSITVVVEDVLPNGNLVVLGKRERETNGDRQIIQISGIVRQADVTFANTVRSEQVADFRVVYKHKGMENRFTKPGWLDRVLNLISPF